MKREKAWVWFKGGLNEGSWVSGFMASKIENNLFLIEHSDYVSCKVPAWRVKFEDPEDKNLSPQIPKDATWKYI